MLVPVPRRRAKVKITKKAPNLMPRAEIDTMKGLRTWKLGHKVRYGGCVRYVYSLLTSNKYLVGIMIVFFSTPFRRIATSMF
jgi:hypothetical protein